MQSVARDGNSSRPQKSSLVLQFRASTSPFPRSASMSSISSGVTSLLAASYVSLDGRLHTSSIGCCWSWTLALQPAVSLPGIRGRPGKRPNFEVARSSPSSLISSMVGHGAWGLSTDGTYCRLQIVRWARTALRPSLKHLPPNAGPILTGASPLRGHTFGGFR